MANELTVLNNTSLQEGGQGVDFSSPLFTLKPATISIVQKNSTIEGAIPGKLRITDTGDMYDEMFCTLLVMPTQGRQYHIGPPGELNRVPENLMCFSRDMLKPDVKSKVPQAMLCAKCPQNDWTAWRENKEKTGFADKNLIPKCDPSYYAVLLDTVYQLPLQMFIRSKARSEFEGGMQNLARTLAIGKAQGKNPNIFDVKFRLGTKQITTGKFTSYVPTFTKFTYITDEEKAVFGDIYLQYVNSKTKPQIEQQAESLQKSQDDINKAVEGEYVANGVDDDIPF